jgi:hypothetical protein
MLPRPQTGDLVGKTWAVKGDTARFLVNSNLSGSVFNWTLTGGTIEAGATTPEILVRFGSTNNATINVQENGSNGCKGVTKSINVSLVNTGLASYQLNEMKLYPNPANHQINLQINNLPANADLKIEVYNVLGEVVKQEQIKYQNQGYSLNLVDLMPGVYVIKAEAKGKSYTKNFIKQ